MIDEDDLIFNDWPVCPFCGHKNKQHESLIDEEYAVQCPECKMQYAVFKHVETFYTTSVLL